MTKEKARRKPCFFVLLNFAITFVVQVDVSISVLP